MKKKANLNRKQLAVIHATHGHRDGGLSLFDVKTKKKVQITNPRFITANGGRTVIASGKHPQLNHRVCGIVKHIG